MTPEQLQQIAEEKYPQVHITDGVHPVIIDITDKMQSAFVHGLTFDRWIKVTPETNVTAEVLCINRQGFMLLGYLSGTTCEDDHQELIHVTHYQFITPPKTDKP
jgi:hypothetical protein